MRTALYEKRGTLPDGTSEVIEGYHKILVQAIIGKEGTPVFKIPPKEMPAKATPKGIIEQAVTKAVPLSKAPPPTAVPMPTTWTMSPPPKKDGLS